jgi:hypothetical protein
MRAKVSRNRKFLELVSVSKEQAKTSFKFSLELAS